MASWTLLLGRSGGEALQLNCFNEFPKFNTVLLLLAVLNAFTDTATLAGGLIVRGLYLCVW
jgi:hypothetical protein